MEENGNIEMRGVKVGKRFEIDRNIKGGDRIKKGNSIKKCGIEEEGWEEEKKKKELINIDIDVIKER